MSPNCFVLLVYFIHVRQEHWIIFKIKGQGWSKSHSITLNGLFSCVSLSEQYPSESGDPALQIRSFNIFAYQTRSHPSCQLFFNNGSLSSLPHHRLLLIWLHFQHESDDWLPIKGVAVGEEGGGGVRGGDGGSCFDLSDICVAAKAAETSMLARSTLTLARELNPSLCVPHSYVDLSGTRQGVVGGK